jgi:ribonuclease PH
VPTEPLDRLRRRGIGRHRRRRPVLDLDYAEDSNCDTDMNVVMVGKGGFVERAGHGRKAPFSRAEMDALVMLAEDGIRR